MDPLFKTYKVRLETTSQVKDAVAEFTLTEGGIAGLKKLNQQAHLRIHLIMDDLMIEKPA